MSIGSSRPRFWIAMATTAALTGLLLTAACRPGTEEADRPLLPTEVDLEGWELEQEEEMLGRLIESLIAQNGSSIYNMRIVDRYARTLERTLGNRQGVSVLEIGPGRNLAAGVMFVLRGMRRYSAVDIYQDPNLYQPSVYQNMERLARIARWKHRDDLEFEDLVQIDDGKVQLDPDRIEWLYPHESYDFPKPEGTVDFVFSHSGFEHFNEPRKTIERIHQVLSPGGVTAHSIDLRDHRDFSKPYAFLELGKKEWRESFTEEELHNYTNQWRAVDFRRAFEDAGFEIVEDDRKKHDQVTETLKEGFHDDFQDYSLEELSTTHLWIVARKPASEI